MRPENLIAWADLARQAGVHVTCTFSFDPGAVAVEIVVADLDVAGELRARCAARELRVACLKAFEGILKALERNDQKLSQQLARLSQETADVR